MMVRGLIPTNETYSSLLRCSTAIGSSIGLSLVGPTKVKAHKSFLLAEGSLIVENNLRIRINLNNT